MRKPVVVHTCNISAEEAETGESCSLRDSSSGNDSITLHLIFEIDCPLSSGIYLSLPPQPEDTGRCCCAWLLCGSWNLSSGPQVFMTSTFLKSSWCCLPVMLTLWRPKQEDCHKFKAKLTFEPSQSNTIMPLSQKNEEEDFLTC